MTLALALVVLLSGVVHLLSFASPLTDALRPWGMSIGLSSVLLILVVAGIARLIPSGKNPAAARLNITLTAMLIASAFLVLRAELWLLPRVLSNFWVVEGLYYSTLAILGIALARFCRAPSYVATLSAVIFILIPAAIQFARLMVSSEASFQYGPEKPLFAISNFVKLMVVSPLDVAVTWSAWKLAQTLQKADQATLPTSGLRPDASDLQR